MKSVFTFFTFLVVLSSFSQTTNEPAIDRHDFEPVLVQPTIAKADDFDEDLLFPYAILDKTPTFANCKYTIEAENRACFQEKLQEHIKKHLKYPKAAKENKVEAKAIVLFEISKEGKITNLRTKIKSTNQDFYTLFEEEAIRIISKLPKFIPGEQKGKIVTVSYASIITFSLSDK
ncbi:energy transducer TonB [Flavobacterium sp. HNIBRBA15423]|uniref:energy transducer TonB n=1 Tax=Flavobacterium sp. HNIBRBA15423 TaxID=3458683 RepID=UPI0040444BAE